MSLQQAIAAATMDAVEARSGHDAIVVGAGAAGGLAAALLAEAGLKVLVLDAGRSLRFHERPLSRAIALSVRAAANPAAMRYLPPRVLWKARQALRRAGRWRQPIQSGCYAWESAPDGFVDDLDNPYEQAPGRPFRWIRSRQLGGRMVVPTHGRQYYRHSRWDFAPEDGLSPEWPIAPGELDPWYELVERRLGLAGGVDDCDWLPDSVIAHRLTPTAGQAETTRRLTGRWPDMKPLLGRSAPPMASLDDAADTGRLLCRQGAVVCGVDVSEKGAVEGVRFIDQASGVRGQARAPLVFLCASALETTRILLLAKAAGGRRGPGAASGALGRYVMDHVSLKAEGVGPATETETVGPDRCVYVPRFDRQSDVSNHPTRGFGVRLYQFRGPPGLSYFTAVSDAELLPDPENRVSLSAKTDRWGVPILRISCAHGPVERQVAEGQKAALRDIAQVLDVKLNSDRIDISPPGSSIHECGGARMGAAPETSVTGPFNEVWDASGLYVTDGAAFPSMGIQNPTLTIMALTARACHHAVGTSKTNGRSAKAAAATA